MDAALKELLNYGAIGLLALMAIGVIRVLWKQNNAISKSLDENTNINRACGEERRTATTVNTLLTQELQTHMKMQQLQNQAVLDLLVSLTTKK